MSETGWIVVRNWDRFQHYRDRRPPWIKVYTALLDDDAFMALSDHLQALLMKLWIVYARNDCRVRDDTATLTRRVGSRVTRPDLDSLVDAGFITISASAPLADRYLRDRDRDKPSPTVQGETDANGGKPTDPFRAGLSISKDVGLEIHVLRLVDDIADADARTVAALRRFAKRLPESTIAQAHEALRTRRSKPGKPLESEARYVVHVLGELSREAFAP